MPVHALNAHRYLVFVASNEDISLETVKFVRPAALMLFDSIFIDMHEFKVQEALRAYRLLVFALLTHPDLSRTYP